MGLKDVLAATTDATARYKANAEELKKREWLRPTEGIIIGDYDQSPYVREGRVFTRALRMHQEVSAPIPAGESGITGLATGANGKIYGATSGVKSHLFLYDPAPTGDGVIDIGVLPGVKAARRTLAASNGEKVFVAASEMIEPGASGPIFVHDTAPDYSDEFRAYSGTVEQLVVPVDGECVAALVCDPKRQMLYGVSSVAGTFFSYDYEKKKLKKHGNVSKDSKFSKCLVMDGEGRVYGTHSLGTLFRYSPDTDQLEDLGVRIPSVAGRDFYNALDSAVFEPKTGLIYGAGIADGLLFSLNPETLETKSLGKVTAEPRVRAMTVARDGRVFGVAGNENGMAHLFFYDPQRHELKGLGIMLAASEVWRRGFEFDGACTGVSGELYFGENEREGHLFMYFPAPRCP